MNVTILAASPRGDSLSRQLAESLAKDLREQGHEVEFFDLAGKRYGGCVGCRACKEGAEGCVLRDALTPVLGSVLEAQAVVLASGVFFADLPSQAKAILDRFYGFYRPHFWESSPASRFSGPKVLGFLLVQGDGDGQRYGDIATRYGNVLKPMGWRLTQPLRFIGIPEGAITKDQRALVTSWAANWVGP